AEAKDLRKDAESRDLSPVMHGRQRLAAKFAIRGSLEPAHAGDGKVRLILRECAQFPAARTRPAGCVAQERHRLLQRNVAAILAEWMTPILRIPVTTGIDELFELTVGHLELVEKVVGQ